MKFAFIAAAALSLALLTGCGGAEVPDELVGSWERCGETYVFTSGGNLRYPGGSLRYEASNNGIMVYDDERGREYELEYTVNADGSMTLNGVSFYRHG